MAAPESRGDTETSRRGSSTRKTAVLLALRHYGRELFHQRRVALPGLLLPALGDIGLRYVAPLVVAKLAGRLVSGADTGAATVLLPYVGGFAALMLLAEVLWRVGIHCVNRTDGRGIEHLYVVGMNELLAKDAAFFHDNFAGSLTKRVLSFAARFRPFPIL
jgi:ATP-binding cassette subfamily B protein